MSHISRASSTHSVCWPQHLHSTTLTLPLLLPDADDVTRGKLSHLDSKLAKLERRMEVIEGTLQSVSHEKAFCK